MRKVVAFSGLAALGFCAWRQFGVAVADAAHPAAAQILIAGAVFTLAIAVFIRD